MTLSLKYISKPEKTLVKSRQLNIEFVKNDDTTDMCSIPDCVLCEKLNEVGAVLFPKWSVFAKEFDEFGSLFYHKFVGEQS